MKANYPVLELDSRKNDAMSWSGLFKNNTQSIDVGTGGTGGGACPQDFAIDKEVSFLFLENAPFLLRKKCPRGVVSPKFEMLPTSLTQSSSFFKEYYVLPWRFVRYLTEHAEMLPSRQFKSFVKCKWNAS